MGWLEKSRVITITTKRNVHHMSYKSHASEYIYKPFTGS